MARIARSVADVIAGEAGGKTMADRYRDMVAIASTIANRAAATGVSLQDIVSAPNQYQAYGKALPPGTEGILSMAEMAINQVVSSGPSTSAMYYATPAAAKNLPTGLTPATETTAHQYFDDTQNRAIATSQGYITPSPANTMQASLTGPVGVSTPASAAQKSVTPGAGLANLTGGYGPMRPAAPDDRITNAIRASVANTFGPEYGVVGISGQQTAAQKSRIAAGKAALAKARKGLSLTAREQADAKYASMDANKNNRHPTGLALDFDVVDPSGKKVTDTNALNDLAANFAFNNPTAGVGFGTDYMVDAQGLPGRMHLDLSGLAGQWGALGRAANMDPALAQTIDAARQGFAPTPFSNPATPSAKPNPNAPSISMALSQEIENNTNVPAHSVRTSAFGPPADAPEAGPYADDVGFFGGKAKEFAGVPAHSVKSTSFAPEMNIASAPAETASSFTSPKESPAAKALDSMASADDKSFTEVAGTPVGTAAYATTNMPGYSPAAAPAASNAYATTNLPGFGYTPLDAAAIDSYVPSAPVQAVQPVQPTAVPQVAKPVSYAQPAPQRAAPAPSIPSGTQAGLDFNAGKINSAVASNGNTLTRDAFGNTYNYSPNFDVTTISNPAGITVGVKTGKVTADTASSDTSKSKGLFSGLGFGLSDDPDSLGNEVGNAAVGGLGGLGGAAVGGLFGPIGSMIGAAIGRNLATKYSPFAQTVAAKPGMFAVSTPSGLMQFHSPVGGLGFPDAPKAGPGIAGGKQSNRSMSGMRGISPGAAAAIGRGQGGLY